MSVSEKVLLSTWAVMAVGASTLTIVIVLASQAHG